MGSGHSHHHAADTWAAAPAIERRLWIAVIAWAVLTLAGAIALWPGGTQRSEFSADPTVHGRVTATAVGPCTGTEIDDLILCRTSTVEITSGSARGSTTELEQGITASQARVPQVGDELILYETISPDGTFYSFADYERSNTMVFLLVIFAVAVLVLGRWRGLGALAGLAISVMVLLGFVLPALLDGSNPVLVAIVGASAIAFASLYLAHGFNSPTNVALLSTLAALSITGVLAWIFIEATTLTGLTDENAGFLEALGVHIDPRGLLLAGVVLGSLGVLDDVTVTQVSAVGELRRAKPDSTFTELYRSALVIGRDHVSSTVNTLFLAYAGAALPLLLLFTTVRQPVGTTATSEVVAVEIVRTLVGSIGLLASVPIATAMAAALLGR